MTKPKKSLIVMLFSMGVLALLAAAIGGGSGAAAESPESAPTGGSISPPGEPPLYVGKPGAGPSIFSALEPATAAGVEALPAAVVSVLANKPTADFDAPTLAAVGTVESGLGSQTAIAEVDGELCTVVSSPELQGAVAGMCSSLSQAESGESYVALPDLSPDSVRVIGLAPDGVTSIAIDSNADGVADETVRVLSNVYQVDLKPVHTLISGITKDGESLYELSLPLGADSSVGS